MELVWLVYGISLLKPLTGLGIITCLVTGALAFVLWGMCVDGYDKPGKGTWAMTIIFVLSAIFTTILPTEKTAYTMVGAYAVQKIAEQPEVSDISKDVLTIINSKVKQYAEEAVSDLDKVKNK